MEKLFTMKKGTEFPEQFAGAVIPYIEADNLAHAIELANGEANLVAIFNQAFRLNVQKAIKAAANAEGATLETLRAVPANYKPESVRVRDPNAEPKSPSSGVIKEAKAKASALDKLLAAHPELREQYADELASLNVGK